MLYRAINWPRLALPLIDAAMFNACIIAALWLRFEGIIPAEYWSHYCRTALWVTAVLIAISYAVGLYNRIWEFASSEAVYVIVLSVTATLGIVLVVSMLQGDYGYPRSVIAMAWGFSILLIGASRFGWRALRTRLYVTNGAARHDRRRVLIYGASQPGVLLAGQAHHDPASPYEVVGFIDDAPRMRGMVVGGYRVLGTATELEDIVRRHQVQDIIAASTTTTQAQLNDLVARGSALGVRVRTVPRMLELIDREPSLPRVRDIDVSDLIGRSAECPDLALSDDYLSGRTVLLTGAGGSIGSEISRQLCRYRPGRVVLLGRGENRIHSIYYELRDQFPAIRFEPVICNVTSPHAVADVLVRFRPEVVFHAAAHKHVYLMECNPVEAVRNNVLGTVVLADLAAAHAVERLILVSTDKATEPTCVMGATKALCERIIADRHANGGGTRCLAVRFGNVLGSAGSVVPIFRQLVEEGKPLTVTDPAADRFFMTIEEAAFLVLQAGAIGEGGELFVLDMGQPVKIVDIARTILSMHGRDPDTPGAIRFIGLRPGEKLHETLVNPHETLVPTGRPKIFRVQASGTTPATMSPAAAVEVLRDAVDECDVVRVLEILCQATNARIGDFPRDVTTTALAD